MISHSEAIETRRCRRCDQLKTLNDYKYNEQARCHGRTCIVCLDKIRQKIEIKPPWEIHVGSVRLYIVGPGQHAMHRCSEPVYRGKIGTPEEWNIARKALRILNQEHGEDLAADGDTIQQVLERVKNAIGEARVDNATPMPPKTL